VKALAILPSILAEPRRLRTVCPDIYSVMAPQAGTQMYDRRAAIYDRVVGTRAYNRIAWGTTPEDFAAFARQAVLEAEDNWLLDAAGGSVLFTADLYLEHRSRPVLVLDQSISMLRLARQRLVGRSGGMPEHVALLQADLRDLNVFLPASIGTVMSLNVLHHMEAASALIADLGALLAPGAGSLFLTSLVTSSRWSDLYLKALYRAGVLVRPRSGQEVAASFAAAGFHRVTAYSRGNMLYARAKPG